MKTVSETWAARATWLLMGVGIAWAESSVAASSLMDNIWRFAAGDPISAEEMNANFQELATRIGNTRAATGARAVCGTTTARVNGKMGGYAAAAQLCRAATGCNASARMCFGWEAADWAAGGGALPTFPPGVSDYWVSNAASVVSAQNSVGGNDCGGWTNAAGTTLGITWSFNYAGHRACNESFPILCCHRP